VKTPSAPNKTTLLLPSTNGIAVKNDRTAVSGEDTYEVLVQHSDQYKEFS
jgi:hypothetical protein